MYYVIYDYDHYELGGVGYACFDTVEEVLDFIKQRSAETGENYTIDRLNEDFRIIAGDECKLIEKKVIAELDLEEV
jgi:hypothetical protein